jgi:predicted transcriptional regulator
MVLKINNNTRSIHTLYNNYNYNNNDNNANKNYAITNNKQEDDSKAIAVVDIIHALSSNTALLLFDAIAIANGTSDILISKLNLTRKQFYSRMSCFMECGLVKRKNGRYILTSFGKVIYSIITTIKRASECYSKLKIIDVLETSNDYILREEMDNIIDVLLKENPQFRQIVVR